VYRIHQFLVLYTAKDEPSTGDDVSFYKFSPPSPLHLLTESGGGGEMETAVPVFSSVAHGSAAENRSRKRCLSLSLCLCLRLSVCLCLCLCLCLSVSVPVPVPVPVPTSVSLCLCLCLSVCLCLCLCLSVCVCSCVWWIKSDRQFLLYSPALPQLVRLMESLLQITYSE
jgi:hypothetical protein